MAEIKYEDGLAKLEELVHELDASELGLEDRLKKFEEGTKLARQLLAKIEKAQKKVEVLIQQDEKPEFIPFDDDDANVEGRDLEDEA